MVQSEWQTQPSGPARRVYTLTDAGQAKLSSQVRAWSRFSKAVNDILGDTLEEPPMFSPLNTQAVKNGSGGLTPP